MTKRQLLTAYEIVNKCSTEYIFDLPNRAFRPKISRKCMARRSSRHDPRDHARDHESWSPCCCIERHWLFMHVMWCMSDQ